MELWIYKGHQQWKKKENQSEWRREGRKRREGINSLLSWWGDRKGREGGSVCGGGRGGLPLE